MDRSAEIKSFYRSYADRIASKRHQSPYWLRRYAHRAIHEGLIRHLRPGDQVLDAGCGEGVLTCLAAAAGASVIATDISQPNVAAAMALAADAGVRANFSVSDAERLPFPDDSFDVVMSSHVLEHLPDIQAGLREIHRLTRRTALIAMPTCLNPAAWSLLGGDTYWKLGPRTLFALPWGFGRTIGALVRGEQGVDEGYGGADVPHVWRFPWVMRRQIEAAGLRIVRFEPGPLLIPYLAEYLPPMRRLQAFVDATLAPSFNYCGYGSLAVCVKATQA